MTFAASQREPQAQVVERHRQRQTQAHSRRSSGANDSGIRVQQSLSLSLPPSPALLRAYRGGCQGVGAKLCESPKSNGSTTYLHLHLRGRRDAGSTVNASGFPRLRISTWLDAAIPSQAATFFHRRAYDAALVARLITLGKT